MRQAFLGVSLCLCINSLTSVAANCHIDGPGSCQFQTNQNVSTFCDWHPNGNVQLINNGFGGWYAAFNPGTTEADLTSRTTCATGGQTLCFRFTFRFEADNELVLSVSIRYDRSEQDDSLLWILSSGSGWQEAIVPSRTNSNFSVIFTARRVCEQYEGISSVGIDNIRYDYTDSCRMSPSSASPFVFAPSVPCNSTISPSLPTTDIFLTEETTAEKTTDDSFITKPTNSGGQPVDHTKAVSLINQSSDSDNRPEKDRTAAIVGGVLASVAIVATVIIILVVLVRTKRLQLGKLCFHDTQQEPQDNDGYEIPLPRGHNNPDMAQIAEQGNTREATPRTDRVSTQTEGQTPRFVNNYDSLDFTSTEQDKRVYTSLYDGPAPLTASGQPGLYQALGQRRDSHVYCQAQGSRQDTDNMNSAVYYNVVER